MKPLAKWLMALENLIFLPSYPCPFCGEELDSDLAVCTRCLGSLSIGWRKDQLHGYYYFSLFPYQGFARDLIHQMKFQSGYELAHAFGELLALACQEERDLAKTNLVIPVPLHTGRLTERGFNQATILADRIGKMCKWQMHEGFVRTKSTLPQSGLSLAERQKNLRGAFSLLPGVSLAGKLCLIVDDVITSGSTFRTIAQEVERYGGQPLGVFLSRTEIFKE